VDIPEHEGEIESCPRNLRKTGCSNLPHVSITSGGIFDIDEKRKEAAERELDTAREGFWNDNEKAQETLKKIKTLRDVISMWDKAKKDCDDIQELYSLSEHDDDAAVTAELLEQTQAVEKEVAHLEFVRKLSGEDDNKPAILTVHSGAGGTESCDWCDMLFRMYCRWMEKKGFAYTVLDSQPGEGAGLKSVTAEVQGEFVYGHLKAECGVHRLVRISPFDSNARRHTSFASVSAYPMIEDADEFELDENDIRVDTYRASGAGGQHVNKTDSAVRMTHIPTNIVVACQNERSQLKNRDVAMKVLKSRVKQFYKEQDEKKRTDKLAVKKKIEWGSQIRSYVLHPYNMVKDHRTEVETSNALGVLDGDIDMFIEAYLLNFQ
jgi:peptide chain release factor 2